MIKKSTLIKRSKSEEVVFIAIFIVLALHSLSFLFAYALTIINTFKDPLDYALGNTWRLPSVWHFDNYVKVFRTLNVNDTSFLGLVFNSIWQTVLSIIPPTITVVMTSYAYSRYKFFCRKILFTLSIILMTISLPGSLPASYKLYANLGLRNTPLFYIGAFAGLGSSFIVFIGFWRTISWSYAEAAIVDGAGDFTIFLKIMVPQATSLIGIMCLLSFISGWNDVGTSMIYLPDYPSISYGLYVYRYEQTKSLDYPMFFTALILTAVPSLILYGVFQDKIMAGMNIGGLKG